MTIAKIHNVFKELTGAEKKIATYILAHPEKIVYMTAKELADKCKTAPSAVIRMCKSVGFEGFSELKISLAGDNGKKSNNKPAPAREDSTEAIFNKVFTSGINTLNSTFEMLDFSVVENIAKHIYNANRTFIFGIGTSSVIAVDANYRFSQLGLQVYAYTDILYMNVMAMNMKPGDVAIGISHSGTTKAVVDAMRHAKEAGAKTIAITSFTKSLLYKESDFAVSVYADEENYPIEAVSARIAHMCVVDALMMTLSAMKSEKLDKYISVRNEALDEIRY